MPYVYRFVVLQVLLAGFFATTTTAQQTPLTDTPYVNSDTIPDLAPDTTNDVTSMDATLLNIFNQRTPKKYKIAGITVTGNKYFDEALLVSISTLTVGEEVVIPGGDNFAKAIQKLWSQNYFSDVEIYLTRLEGNNIYVEIAVQERPRLADFTFEGVKKAEQDDLKTKSGLIKGRVITENMKRTAEEAITKFYAEKGYRSVSVDIKTKQDTALANSQVLTFVVDRGNKIKISDIYFIHNDDVEDAKLEKQMKGTKEMTRLTLFPPKDPSFLDPQKYSFSDYMSEKGFFYPSLTKKVLDPYVRLKFFSSAKFNEKKYNEDKQKLIDYYNSLGHRDAVLVDDTLFYNNKGNLDIAITVAEGHKYYFGNITWNSNTKYPDSLLTAVLGINKGDIYNLDLLNKKLGKIFITRRWRYQWLVYG